MAKVTKPANLQKVRAITKQAKPKTALGSGLAKAKPKGKGR
jgi:hypothetical protein